MEDMEGLHMVVDLDIHLLGDMPLDMEGPRGQGTWEYQQVMELVGLQHLAMVALLLVKGVLGAMLVLGLQAVGAHLHMELVELQE